MTEQQPEAREVKRLQASAAAADALIREILESLCRRDGLPMESSVVPGEPARNYDLAMRLGIGHVFGISGGPESHGAGTGSLDTAQDPPSTEAPSREALGASSPERPAAAEVSLEMCRAFGREIGLVQVERDEARAKLAAIEAHCRKHAEWVSLHCPDLGRPAEALVKADDILAITGTGGRQESPGVALIRAERARQVTVEGYTPEHDAEHDDGALISAAVAYATDAVGATEEHTIKWWPWPPASFKPGPEPLDSLIKAGALIAAELDRITGTEEDGRG